MSKTLETRLQRLEQRIKPSDDRERITEIVVSGKSPGDDDREDDEDAFILEVHPVKR